MRHFGLSSLILAVLLFLFCPTKVFAQEAKFSTKYNVLYTIHESGITTVTQHVQLTNLTSEYYAQEYVLKLGSANVSNLRALDRLGPISVVKSSQNGHTDARLRFNESVAGVGKALLFSLTYETSEIAHHAGSIWEVIILPPDLDQNSETYSVSIFVPESFGASLYQKPKPNGPANTWLLSSSANSGIALAFAPGQQLSPSQHYDFSLKYHLQNQSLTQSISQIALPPDTSYQKVFLRSISPQPINVTQDTDGNWIASFEVPPRSTIDVLASGSVEVFLRPKSISKTAENLAAYLAPSPYWQTADPKIKAKAKELKTPRQIYNYVVSLLSYDKTRISQKKGRLGAKEALLHPKSAICMEFTDLFIAISRAAGIPAREIDGFGYTRNETRQPVSSGRDVLHAWPSYFDSQTKVWRMVDPTWGNSTGGIDYFDTFDLNHIAFAIRGQSSITPLPAGAYKISKASPVETSQTKDLQIKPSSNFPSTEDTPKLEMEFAPLWVISAVPSPGELTLRNKGPASLEATSVEISSNLVRQKTFQIPKIPPFGLHKQTVWVSSPSWRSEGDDIITLTVGPDTKKFFITQIPVHKSWPALIVGGLIVLVIISIITKVTRRPFS